MHEGNRINKSSEKATPTSTDSIAGLIPSIDKLLQRTDTLAARIETLADKVGGAVPQSVKSSTGETGNDSLLFRLQSLIAHVETNVDFAFEHLDRLSYNVVG